jgi:aryl-alcohol dehydrogenase-like predicted oxidoreductase
MGFGAWQLGNEDFFGPMSTEEAINLVTQAYEKGIRFFDTAPGYASGKSEMILGMALSNVRKHVFINSKFGHRADGSSDFSVSSMEPALQDSLSRLKTTYLDSFILHNPSSDILQGKTGHFEEFKRLKSIGLIRHYGVSIDTYEELQWTLQNTDSDCIELLFNVFSQSCLPLFKEIEERCIILITKVPLDSGWLSGKYTEKTTFTGIRSRWQKADILRRLELTNKLKEIVHDDNLTPYALGFILSFSVVSVVIPGIRSLYQLNEVRNILDQSLSESIKQKFMDFYDINLRDNPLPW